MLRSLFSYLFIASLSFTLVKAQSAPSDTIKKKITPHDTTHVRRHPPNAAMIMSACLPGLGQAYNRKFWKIPLIYAAMGTTIYFFKLNDNLYKQYNQAYINKIDTSTSTVDNYPEYSATQLSELKDYHRKYRDLNVILTALFYSINIVDAYVDAHLMNFDVSDDLSFRLAPAIDFYATRQKPTLGMSLSLRF